MDPNRRNLGTVLKFPTKRLLRLYKVVRQEYYNLFSEETVADCYCDYKGTVPLTANYKPYTMEWYTQRIELTGAFLNELKEELDRREHMVR